MQKDNKKGTDKSILAKGKFPFRMERYPVEQKDKNHLETKFQVANTRAPKKKKIPKPAQSQNSATKNIIVTESLFNNETFVMLSFDYLTSLSI